MKLRFPSILKITEQQPVEFHEKLRNDYPNLTISRPLQLSPQNLLPGLDNKVFESLQQMLASETAYTFTTDDQRWKVSLTKDFIALSTNKYKKYEEFRERLQSITELFESIYKPSSYIRIGLRYQDLILPSTLGMKPEWKRLIQKQLISELYLEEFDNSVKSFEKLIVLEFELGKANLRHGIVIINEPSRNLVNEPAYMIDIDFFTDDKIKGIENAYRHLDNFNKLSGKLFRWSITDELHNLLNPQQPD